MPLLRFIAITLGLSLMTACITVMRPPPNACQRINSTTLLMNGPVNEKMAACAATELDEKVDTILISSFGGDTKIGRMIGDRIAEHPRSLVIQGECLSSCANYFVPTSETVQLEDGAVIGLHGTPDPRLRQRGRTLAEAEWQDKLSHGDITPEELAERRNTYDQTSRETAAEEDRFAIEHDIPLGWRLYRTEEDDGLGFRKHFQGEFGLVANGKKAGMLIAEQPMLESCLPHITFENAETTSDIITQGGQRMREMKTLDAFFSGTAECRPNIGQRAKQTASD